MAMHILRNLPDHLELLARYVLKSDRAVDSKLASVLQMLAFTEKDLDSPAYYSKATNSDKTRRNAKSSIETSDIQEDCETERPLQLEKWSTTLGSVNSFSGKEDEALRKSVMTLERTVKEQAKKLVEYSDYIKRLEHTVLFTSNDLSIIM